MSILNSKFDITSIDTPYAVASLAQVLDVSVGAVSGLYSGAGTATDWTGGTPQTGATSIPPGTIVSMNSTGQAIVGPISPVIAGNDPILYFVVVDGNTDYSGKFVRRVTALHGGVSMITDQLDVASGSFAIGEAVYVTAAGKVCPNDYTAIGAAGTRRPFGFVGPLGYDSSAGTVHVLVPQGCGC